MNQAAQRMIKYFDDKELKYSLIPHPKEAEQAIFRISFRGKNIDSIKFHIFVNPEGTNLAVRIWSIAKVPEPEKIPAVLTILNTQNLHYRWYRFALDEDNEITANTDAVVTPDTAGAVAHELIVRGVRIVEEIYPFLMKAIWGN